jgi:hypothetical protein
LPGVVVGVDMLRWVAVEAGADAKAMVHKLYTVGSGGTRTAMWGFTHTGDWYVCIPVWGSSAVEPDAQQLLASWLVLALHL